MCRCSLHAGKKCHGLTEFACHLQQGQPPQTAVRREMRRRKERCQQNLNPSNPDVPVLERVSHQKLFGFGRVLHDTLPLSRQLNVTVSGVAI